MARVRCRFGYDELTETWSVWYAMSEASYECGVDFDECDIPYVDAWVTVDDAEISRKLGPHELSGQVEDECDS